MKAIADHGARFVGCNVMFLEGGTRDHFMRWLSAEHPDVLLRVHEHEPAEAFAALAADDVDLALVYDYNLARVAFDAALQPTPLWTAAWHLAVPSGEPEAMEGTSSADDAASAFRRFSPAGWIVNSRNTADENVVRTIASLAGFTP